MYRGKYPSWGQRILSGTEETERKYTRIPERNMKRKTQWESKVARRLEEGKLDGNKEK